MKYQPAAKDQRALLDEVRSMMAPLNPVAPAAFQAEQQDWIRPAQPERNLSGWRVLAPALSGLSVIAVIAGVTLASGATRPSAPGGSGAPPRFYVTINGLAPKETAIVHSTATGQVLSSVHIPEPDGGLAIIAGTSSDRVFYLTASAARPKTGAFATVILRLSLSASGRSAKLTRLPGYVTDPTMPKVVPFVEDIAVSPDGRQLAVMLEVHGSPGLTITPVSELAVMPLQSGGQPAFWRAPGDSAFSFYMSWVSNSSLAFLWQDHFKGNQADFTARTAVRLLDIRTSNRNLLKSAVLLRGRSGVGVIQSAFAAPAGGPIIAALADDIPATGPKGTAVVRLVAASPATRRITEVFATRILRYRSDTARYTDNDFYGVLGFDASGQDVLVEAPQFGMIRHGKFTKLLPGRGLMIGAAW